VVVQKEEAPLDKNGGPTVTASLLDPSVDAKQESGKRYATSEWHQFWVILKRALLFSRRDWVNFAFTKN
jgi:ATP-binding cassette, subfamily G (WHITE), member 1